MKIRKEGLLIGGIVNFLWMSVLYKSPLQGLLGALAAACLTVALFGLE